MVYGIYNTLNRKNQDSMNIFALNWYLDARKVQPLQNYSVY